MAKPTTKVSSIPCSQRGDTSMGGRDPLLMKPPPGLSQRPCATAARSQESKRHLVRPLVRLNCEPIRSTSEANSVGRWYESAAILARLPFRATEGFDDETREPLAGQELPRLP